ncbi:MAG: hypothetical protein Q4C58_14335 [Eubacteriales bacterium]|nr:hypothetical protein [Eubacteriales bacterium]
MEKLVEEMKTHICDELCLHPRYAESQEELDRTCADCRLSKYVRRIMDTYNELNCFEKTQCAALMQKYSKLVLCNECEYSRMTESTGIWWCALAQGLDSDLIAGDGCSKGKRR